MDPNAFFNQVKQCFRYLIDEYQLTVAEERYYELGFGSCSLVLQANRFFLQYFWDGKDHLISVSAALRLSVSSGLSTVRYGDWIDFERFRKYLFDGREDRWLIGDLFGRDFAEQLVRLDSILRTQWQWLLPLLRLDLFRCTEFGELTLIANDNEDIRAQRLINDGKDAMTELLNTYKFLSTDFGFHCTHANLLYICFIADGIFLNLHHDLFGYPPLTYFGPTSNPYERYELEELTRITGKQISHRMFPGHTPRDMLRAASAEAFLNSYAHDVRNAEQYFEQLRVQRQEDDERTAKLAAQREKRQKLYFTRLSADAAWVGKAYSIVVECYESIYADLTPLERDRLAFAKKQIR